MNFRFFLSLLLLLIITCSVNARDFFDTSIRPADGMTASYIHLLKNKRIALVINQTSVVGDSSLLDMLLARGISVACIFVPEHGFRGREDAGAHIDNAVDSATRIPVISLYGSHKKPAPEDLHNIDVVVYDLQDVGVRFYTYISTLEYCMEACAENDKQIIILDRPNPNGFYADGPVLQKENRSFVGMQSIPIVYGMTCGEYAQMLAGEQWFNKAERINLLVIKCGNYTHKKKYELPVAPSPNLRTMAAVYAYPSLCLFEGTIVSVGRGTALPFQQYGYPEFEGKFSYSFTPQSGPGAKKPLYENRKCFGELAGSSPAEIFEKTGGKLSIKWLLAAYHAYPAKEGFFNSFFIKLSGTATLQEMIKRGESEITISASWQQDLAAFKKIRKKYLLYPDFE